MNGEHIKKIIFSAEQRGGFDAFLPVIKKIKNDKKFDVFLFLDNKNIYNFAKKQKIKCQFLTNPSPKRIDKIVKKINPDIIFTDTNNTDFSSSIDKKFIKVAKKLHIQTVNMIDSWVGLKLRFGPNLEYLADDILVIDEDMKKDLISIGISPGIIKVTGNPRFDKFSIIKKVKEEKNLIVFYSQPLFKKKPNEVEIFKDIVEVLEKTYPKKEVIIKFHPTREENRKDRGKYDNIIKESILKIKKAEKKANAEDLSEKAELVIGINSIALVDAALMGKRVLNYQPGKEMRKDPLRSNIYGWSVPVYKKSNLLPTLRDIFKKPLVKKEELEKYTKNNSTDKVINFINKIIV